MYSRKAPAYVFSSPLSRLLFVFLLLFSIRLSRSRYLKQYSNFSNMQHVSSVGSVTKIGSARPTNIVVRFLIAARDWLRTSKVKWILGAHFPGEGGEQPEREVDHSPSSGAQVNKARNYNFTPPFVSMAYEEQMHNHVYGWQYIRNG